MKFNGLLRHPSSAATLPPKAFSSSAVVMGSWRNTGPRSTSQAPTAVPEILKDAASERAQLEVRTYDYGIPRSASTSCKRSYPEAR